MSNPQSAVASYGYSSGRSYTSKPVETKEETKRPRPRSEPISFKKRLENSVREMLTTEYRETIERIRTLDKKKEELETALVSFDSYQEAVTKAISDCEKAEASYNQQTEALEQSISEFQSLDEDAQIERRINCFSPLDEQMLEAQAKINAYEDTIFEILNSMTQDNAMTCLNLIRRIEQLKFEFIYTLAKAREIRGIH